MTNGDSQGTGEIATVEIHDGIAIVTAADSFTGRTIIESRKTLMDRPDFEPGIPVLYNLREMTTLNLTRDQLREAEVHARQVAERRGPHLTAIFARRDVDFGMARMYEMLSDREGTMRVFRDYDEALAWLRQDGE